MPAPPLVAECPSVAALTAFDLGTLADADLGSVAGHLDDCPSCRHALATLLPAADPLIVGIRRYVGRVSAPADARATVDLPAAPVRAADAATVPRLLPPAIDLPDGILSAPLEPGELGRIGSYRVLRVLGKGGMGLVFEAEDTQLHRPVALKVMLPRGANDPRNRERFLREARSAAVLAHDNIVPVFQVGEDRAVLFIAMPLLTGESLQSRLTREAPLPLPDVLRLGRETAAGLAAAHARGLVHRDIKPDNLWLEGKVSGARGAAPGDPPSAPASLTAAPFRVKILDFGLARRSADDSNLTNPGGVIGTPAYMAPEQARGEGVDERADLFSLGAVLYRACTGRPAFRGPDIPALLHAVCYDTPQPPHALDARIPLPLSELIMRLLAKTASARPTAREVRTALTAMEATPFRDTKSVSAGSESWLPAAPVRVQPRRRWLTGVAVALLALLVAGAGAIVVKVIGPDGKETKVEGPPGSSFKIDKDGNIEVTLPPDTQPTKPALPIPTRLAPPGLNEPAPTLPKELPYGLKREVFAGANFDKLKSTAPDVVMQWAWSSVQNPAAPEAEYSVRWSGFLKAPRAGKYRLRFVAQGGVRFWLDGKKRADGWEKTEFNDGAEFELTGKAQEVRIEFRGAALKTSFGWLWTPPGRSEQPVPASVLFPTAPHAEAAQVADDPRSPDELARWWIRGEKAASMSLAFSPDGSLAAFANHNGTITVRDIRAGKEAGVLAGHAPGRPATTLAFTPDGRRLVSGGNESTLRVWDLKTFAEVENWKDFNDGVTSLLLSPEGTAFVATGDAGPVSVRTLAGAKRVGRWFAPPVPQALGWVGERHVVVIGGDDTPRLHEAASGAEARKYAPVLSSNFLTRRMVGSRLLVGEPKGDYRLHLFDLDADPAKRTLWETVLPEACQFVAVSADGRWAACSIGGERWLKDPRIAAPGLTPSDAVILYHLPTGHEVHRFVGHTNWVYTVAFSHDGRRLLSSGTDATVRLWALPNWLFAK